MDPWRVRLLVLVAAAFAVTSCAERRVTSSASPSASRWLELVDQERYEECWLEAAPQFRARQSKEAFLSELKGFRRGLAKPVSRKLYEGHLVKDTDPGQPIVNLVYGASLANGRGFGELIAMIRGSDGQWRPYGYRTVGTAQAKAQP